MCTPLVGHVACLQQQNRLPEWIQSLESRPHAGGGRVSLDSGVGIGGEGLPLPPNSVGRALAWLGVSFFFFLLFFCTSETVGASRPYGG